MNNNNELDNLVESFLSPKPQPKGMDLKELFALFEIMEKTKELLQEQDSDESRPMPITKQEISSAAHLPIEYFVKNLTRRGPQQLDTPESQQVFYSNLQKIIGKGEGLPQRLENFINTTNLIKEGKIKTFSTSLAYIMFASSVFSMIKNYSSQTSGAFYETFIEFLGGSNVSLSPHLYSIYDLLDNGIYWSLKLTSPNTEVSGSMRNMLAFFNYPTVYTKMQNGKADFLHFLITTKVSQTELKFDICYIDLETFLRFPSNHNPKIPIGAREGQLQAWDELRQQKSVDDKLLVLRDYGVKDEEMINSFSISKETFLYYSKKRETFTLSLTEDEVATICSAQAHELESFRDKMKELLVDVDDIYFKAKTFMITNDVVHGQDASDTAGRIQNNLIEMTNEIVSKSKTENT